MGNTIDIGSYKITIDNLIAEGGFSFVYSAHDQKGEKFALKKMLCHNSEQLDDARREIKVLRTVRHSSILPLLGDTSMPSTKVRGATDVFLLFPFCNGGSIFGAIFNSPETTPHPFPEVDALRIFLAICQATNALHQAGYAHRDIKPHNILLNGPSRTPLLIDLGSASQLRREINSRKEALMLQEEAAVHCSAGYRAPELHDVKSSCIVDGKIDVWSLGCTLFAMAFGNCPFETAADGVMTISIMSGNYRIPTDRRHRGQQYSEGFCSLFKQMLNSQPSQRISLPELITRVEMLVHGHAAGDEDFTPEFRSGASATSSETKSVAIDVSPSSSSSTEVHATPVTTITTITTTIPSNDTDVKTSDLFSLLQAGGNFTKFGRSGSPHSTILRVEMKESTMHVTWSHANGRPSRSLPLTCITRIISGQRTPVFARVANQSKYTSPSQLSLSMSIMYHEPGTPHVDANGEPTDERSLDVMAAGKSIYDQWWRGLHQLLPPKPTTP